MDLMIDLETLSTETNATITSIGACFFHPYSPKPITETCHIKFDISYTRGHISPATIKWWLGQEPEAQKTLLSGEWSQAEGLAAFTSWVYRISGEDSLQVWGNGCSFDNVILKHTLTEYGLDIPNWKYCSDRDVRTVVQLGRDLLGFEKEHVPFVGVPHNALDDARHQAKVVTHILSNLTG